MKEGVKIEKQNSLDPLKEYYRLHCMIHKRNAVPQESFTYFKDIHIYVISNNKGAILLASGGEKVVGGWYFSILGRKPY
jgi:hypothetical protein